MPRSAFQFGVAVELGDSSQCRLRAEPLVSLQPCSVALEWLKVGALRGSVSARVRGVLEAGPPARTDVKRAKASVLVLV